MPGGVAAGSVLHLHPLLRCNLACAHCYSGSSPDAADSLDVALALRAVDLAVGWGFAHLSVSGGEPLLYKDLARVLMHARARGLTTGIATNGWFVRDSSIGLFRLASTIGISLDGMEASHNRLRGSPRVIAKADAAMRTLAHHGLPFGIVCGVTRSNLEDLPRIARHTHERGASALQLHPVEVSGRAARLLAGNILQGPSLDSFYIQATALRLLYAGRMDVHADVVHPRRVVKPR